ncbi:MAG: fibrinogen-like YCDxxxxGGGW domain-containing protein [Archangium sp.]|nr:fibrinogen-like YCDxxxxGGGW domain-containing protein [Archangium sp.]
MLYRRLLAPLLLAAVSGCNCGGGAVRVEVRFEGFTPGCLEVTATDAATGEAESVAVLKEKFGEGKAIIGIGGQGSQRLDLRVRSFERGCDGPVVEEVVRESPLALQPRVVAEWVVDLTSVDADADGFAAATPGVKGTDCADDAPARHPGAAETCGVLDLNCDGLAGCFDPLCVGNTCDDGVSTNTLDVCIGDGGCAGRPFTDCAPGTYVTAAGTPTTDRACAPCPSATFSATANAPTCTGWNDCVPGQYLGLPPSSSADRTCLPCAAGTFSSVPNSTGCAPVGTCAPGSAPTMQPTPTTPLVCGPCVAGNYCAGGLAPAIPCSSGTWDDDLSAASACVDWTACAPGSVASTLGTATTNVVCTACAVGNYCPGLLAPLEPCASGTWDHDANAATACVAWSQCAPGFFVTGAGSATSDRGCQACASGTFSTVPDAASCMAWTACAAGQFVSVTGSATTNQACAACTTGFTTTPNSASCTAWTACTADTYESVAPTATSDRGCANYRSCLDRLTRMPGSTTGSYVIDPDGTGSNAPFTVTCDMTIAPGGWTVISFEDFSTAATGWSDPQRDTTSSCAIAASAMLGGYNVFGSGATTTKVFPLLGITHTQARVALDFFVIDSWDNERARVSVDGTYVFDNAFSQSLPDVCGGPWGDRWLQSVVATPAHTGTNLTLVLTTTLNQTANDESWGVDNVSIMIR